MHCRIDTVDKLFSRGYILISIKIEVTVTHMPFEALFEHSSIGIIISNQDGVIERANLYASKMFGYEIEELSGQKIEVLIPSQLRERHVIYREMYNKNPLPRTMGSNLNLLAEKKDGGQFSVEISLS